MKDPIQINTVSGTDFVSIKEAARITGLDIQTVRTYITNEKLQLYKFYHFSLLKRSDLNKLMRK